MPSIAKHQRREPGWLIGRRQDQLAVLRKTPPLREAVRAHPVTLGNLANRHPGPQGLRHNPRLEIIWPPPPTTVGGDLDTARPEKLRCTLHGETPSLFRNRDGFAETKDQKKVGAR